VFTEYPPGEDDAQVIAVDRDPDGDGRLGPATGAAVRETVVSRTTAGTPGSGNDAAVSADGRYVAFDTRAPGMSDGTDPPANGDSDPAEQVVVRDLTNDLTAGPARTPAALASVGTNRNCADDLGPDDVCGGDDSSTVPSLSADGSVVAFTSAADDLVPADTDDEADVFVRQFQPGLTADPADFGTVGVGSGTDRTITLRPTGFGPVRITGITVTGADPGDFTVYPAQNCAGAVLHETGDCLASVRFAPAATGARTAQLVVAVAGRPQPVLVPLTGGAGPAVTGLRIEPAALALGGPRLVLSRSAPGVLTVENTALAPFAVTGVRLLGGPGLYPGDYAITGNTCTGGPLPPGGSCLLTVTDTPLGAGDRPGALELTDTGGDGPQLVALDGSGTAPVLAVSPAVTPAGRVTTVAGTGWPSNHPVTVTLRATAPVSTAIATTPSAATAAGTGVPLAVPVTAQTDAQGGFSVPLVLYPGAAPGSYPVTATAPGTSLTATHSLLVVLGTTEPPGFTTRH
jgi:hypothetical protein